MITGTRSALLPASAMAITMLMVPGPTRSGMASGTTESDISS
jgi:hypothetical protein